MKKKHLHTYKHRSALSSSWPKSYISVYGTCGQLLDGAVTCRYGGESGSDSSEVVAGYLKGEYIYFFYYGMPYAMESIFFYISRNPL